MPTGYTAMIEDGNVSFAQFAMQCARAFGACVMLRDSPMDIEIPEFQPSTYHADSLVAANARLRELEALRPAAAERESEREHEKTVQRIQERAAKKEAINERYRAMLAQVAAWTTPTPDHEGLKKFMREQIEASVHDYIEPMPLRTSGAEWLAKQTAQAIRDIEYHTKKHAEEVERTADRNAWIAALRKSL